MVLSLSGPINLPLLYYLLFWLPALVLKSMFFIDATRRYLTLLLLDAARRCSTLLDAARRCSTLLDAERQYTIRRLSTPLDASRRLSTPLDASRRLSTPLDSLS
jgi:hypothetical protein